MLAMHVMYQWHMCAIHMCVNVYISIIYKTLTDRSLIIIPSLVHCIVFQVFEQNGSIFVARLHNFFPSELEQSTVTKVANPFVDSDTFLRISEISVGILVE